MLKRCNEKPGRTCAKAAGVILAAGLSSRMGETKALLAFGGQKLIERQINCFLSAGVNDIYIVTGHDRVNVEAAVCKYNVKTVYNPDYKVGMFTSVKAGLRAINKGGFDAVFLLPVDCPLVTPHTLEVLIETYSERNADIVYPCHNGDKGHPPFFSAVLIDEILAYSGDGGLKGFFAGHDAEAICAEAGSGCVVDIDTKEEYLKVLELLKE